MDETKDLSATVDVEPPVEHSSGSPAADPPSSGATGSTGPRPGRVRRVYLAHDDELDRPVAIKVPHGNGSPRPEDSRRTCRSPDPRQARPSAYRPGL